MDLVGMGQLPFSLSGYRGELFFDTSMLYAFNTNNVMFFKVTEESNFT